MEDKGRRMFWDGTEDKKEMEDRGRRMLMDGMEDKKEKWKKEGGEC